MRVLVNGSFVPLWERLFKCHNKSCDSLLLVNEQDIQHYVSAGVTTFYFTCVSCNEQTDICEGDIPGFILERIVRRISRQEQCQQYIRAVRH